MFIKVLDPSKSGDTLWLNADIDEFREHADPNTKAITLTVKTRNGASYAFTGDVASAIVTALNSGVVPNVIQGKLGVSVDFTGVK